MAGRSGTGVLVTGFSRVGALKKHAPLVFKLGCLMLPEKRRKIVIFKVTSHDLVHSFCLGDHPGGGGVLNFELGTDVRPEVSTTTL